MTKCPNCGSTAQVVPYYEELQRTPAKVKIITHYKCGCGNFFREEATYLYSGEVKIEEENK